MAKRKDINDVNIDDIFADLDKQFAPPEQLPRVKSGLLSLDIVLGGTGIPRGKCIEVCSASGVGKSTLLLHAARNLCDQGYRVVWIDTEYATDDDLLGKLGLLEHKASGMFKIYQESTFGKVELILDSIIPTGQVPFIVLDSLANLTSEANTQSTVYDKSTARSIEDKQVAGDARSQTLFVKKYKAMTANNNVTMFFINQMRQFIATGYGQVSKEVHAGAKAIKYNMDCIIDLINAGKIKGKKTTINGEEEIDVGSNVFFYIKEKSRICSGGVKVPGAIYFGKGFSNISTVKILMEMKKTEFEGKWVKMLTKTGNTYKLTFNGQQIQAVGQEKLREAIQQHYDEIVTEFGAEDFNVIKEDFAEATAVDITSDPTIGLNEDEAIYDAEDREIETDDFAEEDE